MNKLKYLLIVFALACSCYSIAGNMIVSAAPRATETASTKAIADSWQPMGEGTETGLVGTINSSIVWDDGTGPALYVGGFFESAGDTPISSIARWNGVGWSPVGKGLKGTVASITAVNDELIVGGYFYSADRQLSGAQRWNGREWNELITPLGTDIVRVVGTFQGRVVMASFAFVVIQNGNSWERLGGYNAANSPSEFLEFEGNLLAASRNGVYRWDGTNWILLGEPSPNTFLVSALTVFEGRLFAAGNFTFDGTRHVVSSWDGSRWQPVGANVFFGDVTELKVYGGNLIAAGQFEVLGRASNNIASWNGKNWESLENGVSIKVNSLHEIDGQLIAVQSNVNEGTTSINAISSWNKKDWKMISQGMNYNVHSLTNISGTLYAVLNVPSAIGSSKFSVVRWADGQWKPITSDIAGKVVDLVPFESGLVIAGMFDSVNGLQAKNIARWDGTQWHSVGNGRPSAVAAVESYQGQLFVADYTSIWRWNGSTWTFFEPATGSVDFAVHAGELYMSWWDPTSCLRRWNGSVLTVINIVPCGSQKILTLNGDLYGILNNGFRIIKYTQSGWEVVDEQAVSMFKDFNKLVAVRIVSNIYELQILNGDSWVPYSPSVSGQVVSIAPFDNSSVLAGAFPISSMSSQKFVILGNPEETKTNINIEETSRRQQTICVRVRVFSETAPTTGMVTVTGTPGGSCSSKTLYRVDKHTAEGRCEISFLKPGNFELSARYSGGRLSSQSSWKPSLSAVANHAVSPNIFENGFESTGACPTSTP